MTKDEQGENGKSTVYKLRVRVRALEAEACQLREANKQAKGAIEGQVKRAREAEEAVKRLRVIEGVLSRWLWILAITLKPFAVKQVTPGSGKVECRWLDKAKEAQQVVLPAEAFMRACAVMALIKQEESKAVLTPVVPAAPVTPVEPGAPAVQAETRKDEAAQR